MENDKVITTDSEKNTAATCGKKRPYVKPAIEHDEKLDTFALACGLEQIGNTGCGPG